MIDYLNRTTFARGFATVLAATVALLVVVIGLLLVADVFVSPLPRWFGSWPLS